MGRTDDADNQQETLSLLNLEGSSETIRQAPLLKVWIESYLLGALHDGTFSSNDRFRFSQKGRSWLEILKALLEKIDYNSWIYKEGKNRDVYVLETLADFLEMEFDPLTLKENGEKICYIKGFFDAEGGIPKDSKARFYIQLAQKDKKKIKKIKWILEELGIKTGKVHNPSKRIDPHYWRIYVSANFQQKFVDQIGSWHPRKVKILQKRMKR